MNELSGIIRIEGRRRRKIARRKRIKRIIAVISVLALSLLLAGLAEKKECRIIGYTYDSGSTVWELAQRCCPDHMDIRDVVEEIETINGIENSAIYANRLYQIPVYGN